MAPRVRPPLWLDLFKKVCFKVHKRLSVFPVLREPLVVAKQEVINYKQKITIRKFCVSLMLGGIFRAFFVSLANDELSIKANDSLSN